MGLSWLVWLVWNRSYAGLAGIDAYIGGAGIVLGEVASQTRWVGSVTGKEIGVYMWHTILQ